MKQLIFLITMITGVVGVSATEMAPVVSYGVQIQTEDIVSAFGADANKLFKVLPPSPLAESEQEKLQTGSLAFVLGESGQALVLQCSKKIINDDHLRIDPIELEILSTKCEVQILPLDSLQLEMKTLPEILKLTSQPFPIFNPIPPKLKPCHSRICL